MDIALHFQESIIESGLGSYSDLEAEVLTTALEIVPQHRRHFRVRTGNMSFPRLDVADDHRLAVASNVVAAPGTWTTINRPRKLVDCLLGFDLAVILFEGLAAADAKKVDEALDQLSPYLGALQVDRESELHFAFYTMQLPLKYRISGRAMFLLHGAEVDPAVVGEDNRDHDTREAMADEFVGAHVDSVGFQNIGLQETMFDPYADFRSSRIMGRTSGLLDAYYDAIIGELLIRFREADPHLIEALDAAIGALDRHDLTEQLAQAALSCRRFLERLADVLYPPRPGRVNGREVGSTNYKNRLWAYAAEHIRADERVTVVLTAVADVGGRVDKLVEAANTGIHADTNVREVHRLVLGLVTLAYDLLTLTPPTGAAAQAYDAALMDEVRRFLETSLRSP